MQTRENADVQCRSGREEAARVKGTREIEIVRLPFGTSSVTIARGATRLRRLLGRLSSSRN
jgi:hypothetical protein